MWPSSAVIEDKFFPKSRQRTPSEIKTSIILYLTPINATGHLIIGIEKHEFLVFFSPGSSQVEGRLNLNLFDRVVKNVYKETSQSAWALQICQIRPTQGLIGRFYTTK